LAKLSCIYHDTAGASDAVDGRTRVYGLIFTGTHASITADPPLITLRDGSASGDILIQVNDNPNSTDTTVYGSVNSLDFPGGGVLFPNGIHATLYTNCKGVSIICSGGAAS
jgi:hypothetical protein